MKYNFADYNIGIETNRKQLDNRLKDYIADYENEDLNILISEKDFKKENEYSEEVFTPALLEFTAIYRKLAEWLPQHGAFVLHSSVIDVDGTGIAFAAHSGTGKTTHTLLWQKLLGERLKIVNGDKPIVRFFDSEPNTPYAYGTPWNGKERLGRNMRTELKHICFIERSNENFVEKLSPAEVIEPIFNQVYMPKTPQSAAATISLINRFITSCSIWKIHCNMDISAAQTAVKAILGDNISSE